MKRISTVCFRQAVFCVVPRQCLFYMGRGAVFPRTLVVRQASKDSDQLAHPVQADQSLCCLSENCFGSSDTKKVLCGNAG